MLVFECREEHPDLVESMAKKGSNVPEKPKTPQQLWYNHEKKAFLKTHPDVSLSIGKQHAKRVVLNCICVVVPTSILFYRHQATTKDIKDSLGKQWTQLSDKKRLKWITKSLEQRKQYEVGAGSCGGVWNSDDRVSSVFSGALFSPCCILGVDAGVHPAASRVKHDPRRHRKVDSDQGREAPERQIRWPARQTTSVSHSRKRSPAHPHDASPYA